MPQLQDTARSTPQSHMLAEVREGLSRSQKEISPKYFYDHTGSLLFEQITELPEYYLTRTETALLEEIAPGLMRALAPEDIVELGAGSAVKTRRLLDARNGLRQPIRYVPIDVDDLTIETAAARLLDLDRGVPLGQPALQQQQSHAEVVLHVGQPQVASGQAQFAGGEL